MRPPADKSFKEQLGVLFKEISRVFKCPVIYGLQVADKPLRPAQNGDDKAETDYPFISYTILSSNMVANIEHIEEFDDENVKKVWDEQYELTLSVIAAHDNPYDALEMATRAKDWLTNASEPFLTTKDLVIVSVTPITARDFFMAIDFERRMGFDVRIRMARQTEAVFPQIKTVEIVQK